jgi:hypothetical protein
MQPSNELQLHMFAHALEGRLRTLDKEVKRETVRVWEGTWAHDLLTKPEFQAFRVPGAAYTHFTALSQEVQKPVTDQYIASFQQV